MRLAATEIQAAKAALRAGGWLSRCPSPFAEAVLAQSQWMSVEIGQPIALGGDADPFHGAHDRRLAVQGVEGDPQ